MVIPNKELGVVQVFKEVFYFLRNSVGLDSAVTLLKSTFPMSVIRALLEEKTTKRICRTHFGHVGCN